MNLHSRPLQRKQAHLLACIPLTMIAALASSAGLAVTRTWPGIAPCSTSLALCIDSAGDGDVIEIAANSVDESIAVSLNNKSLTLRPAPGFTPVWVFGRSLLLRPSGSTNRSLRVTGLHFDGVTVNIEPSGSSIVELDHLNFLRLPPGFTAINIVAQGKAAAPTLLSTSIHDNRFVHDAGRSIAIYTGGEQVSGRVSIRDNQIDTAVTTTGSDNAILISLFATGAGIELDITGNRVHPRDWNSGENGRVLYPLYVYAVEGSSNNKIRVVNNSLVASRVNSVSGFGALTISDGGSNQYRVVNNTVIGGKPDGVWMRALSTSTGVFANNVVFGATNVGVNFLGNTDANFSNHHNAVFGSASNNFTPGAGTLTTDPLLGFNAAPRPGAGSPLVNAGSSGEFTVAGPGTLPSPAATDADGLRRMLGSAIDIGAHEYGTTSIVHDASGSATGTTLNHPALNANPAAVTHITRSDGRLDDALVLNPRPMSQSYSDVTQRWSLIADDGFNLNSNSGFSLLNALPGGEVGTTVVSSGSVFSVSGTSLPMPWALLPSDWIFQVSATRGAGLSATANPHPFGAAYINSQWRIINLDAAAMPIGTAFAIYAQPPSRNAFEHTVLAANQPVPAVSVLDHALLNGFPCAAAHVSASGNGFQAIPPFSVHYESGLQRWFVQSETPPAALAPGSKFFIVVDPKSVEGGCVGTLFIDGFED